MKVLLFSTALLSTAIITAETENKKVQKLEERLDKIAQAEQKMDGRIGEIVAQAIRIDARCETLISNTIELFQKVRDSKETGSKVIRHKKDLIRGLEKSIKLYVEIQETVNKTLKITGVNYGVELVKFHKWVEDRITKRVKQVTELTKSFETYRDVYDEHDRDDDYSRDRKNARRGDKERGKVVKDMERAIKKLEESIKGYEKELQTATSSKKVSLISLNIDTAYDKISQLESSVQDILTNTNYTQKTGRKGEQNISKQLTRNAKSLKANMDSMLSHLRSIIDLAKQRAKLRYHTTKTEKSLKKSQQ